MKNLLIKAQLGLFAVVAGLFAATEASATPSPGVTQADVDSIIATIGTYEGYAIAVIVSFILALWAMRALGLMSPRR